MIHATIVVKGGGGRVIRDWTGTVEELAQLEPTFDTLQELPFVSRLTVTLKADGREPVTTTLAHDEPFDSLRQSSMLTGEPKLDEPIRPPAVPAGDPPVPPGTKVKATGVVVTTPVTDPYPTTIGTIPVPPAGPPKKWDPTRSQVFPPYPTTDQIMAYAGMVEQFLCRLEPGFRWEVSRPIRASMEAHLLTARATTGKGEVVCAVRTPFILPRDMSAFEGIALSEAGRIVQSIRQYLSTAPKGIRP